MSLPEDTSTFYARRARERSAAMLEDIKSGKIAPSASFTSIYEESRAKVLQAKQEARTIALDPKNNTVEAWRNSPIASGLQLPPNDPKVLEEKQKLINGGR